MTKPLILVFSVLTLTSCNNGGKTTGQKLDTLIRQADTTADQLWDSTKSKTKKLTEEIRERFDKRDSVNRKDSPGQ